MTGATQSIIPNIPHAQLRNTRSISSQSAPPLPSAALLFIPQRMSWREEQEKSRLRSEDEEKLKREQKMRRAWGENEGVSMPFSGRRVYEPCFLSKVDRIIGSDLDDFSLRLITSCDVVEKYSLPIFEFALVHVAFPHRRLHRHSAPPML